MLVFFAEAEYVLPESERGRGVEMPSQRYAAWW